MTDAELRRFMARRAFRDISEWGRKLSEKIQQSYTYTSVELQVLKMECDAFRENLEEVRTKYPAFVGPEMVQRMETFIRILANMDWTVR